MRIAVLGPLEVRTDDGVPLTVPGAKERLLLAILTAGASGAVSLDALAEALWDGDPPATARKSLQIHVVKLRSSLEPDRPRGSTGRFVARRGPGYALTVPRDAIDALRIDSLAAQGRALLTSGRLEEAARKLAAAVDLWRGEPYADWPGAPFAGVERRRLSQVHAGAVAGLLEARLQLGAHAEVLPQLDGLVAADPLREDWWRLLMWALYRAGRQADALAAGRRARAVLAEEIGAGPGPGLRAMEAAILTQDPALDAPPRTAQHPRRDDASPTPGACPYKGLAVYEAADAPLFHGRERLIASLVARLVDAPVLVVSGPSGAGKSSAVRAGLVPALAAGGLPGSQSWRPVILTPGRAPVDALAQLTGDPSPAEPVLLVCDQFEELWAPGIDPAERTEFLDAVAGLVDDGIVVRCVVVIRGDHVGRLAEHRVFTERLASAFALVPPLTDAELREIVTEPARSVGLRVDPELADSVVADVLGQLGALPLLSTALVGTWERRRGDLLTLAGYLEAGGVAGALNRSAEAVYGALDDAGRGLARRLFVRLADTDNGGALVRRRVPLAELGLAEDPATPRRQVVESFVGRRLLSVDENRLEVAHEALLTAWPRLVRWLEDDAAGRAVRRHLDPAAREWDASGRPDDELYRGARLTAALDWSEDSDAVVTPVEQQFLDASRAAADADLNAAQRRADREAAARHRTRRLAGGLAVVLVVALVATFLAVRAQRDAVRAQREAQQASLVADAKRLAALSATASSVDVSLLLAVQAVRLAETPETQDALLGALTEHGRAERAVAFDEDPLGAAYLANGGRTLFLRTESQVITWAVDSSARPEVAFDIPNWGTWSNSAPSPIEDAVIGGGQDSRGYWLRIVHADGTGRVLTRGDELGGLPVGGVFSPDGHRVTWLLSTPGRDDPEDSSRWTLTDVDAEDGTTRKTGIGGTYPAPFGELQVDFTDDGSSAVLWSDRATDPAIMIDLADGKQTPTPVQDGPGRVLEYRATGSGAAQLWLDGGVTLFDREGTAQHLDAHRSPVRDVVVAPDGGWGATVGHGPLIVVWDIDPTTGRWTERGQLTGHAGDIIHAEVDPSGDRLITIGLDRTILTWNMTAEAGLGTSNPGLDGRWIANRPQAVPGGLIVAPTRPGASPSDIRRESPGPETLSVAATFLDPDTGEVVDQVVLGDTTEDSPFGSSVTVSPDRSMVAVTWGLGTTVLDTRTHEVIKEIVLPPDADAGVGDRPLPATVVRSSGWTPDGSTLLLAAEGKIEESTWSTPAGAAADSRRGGYLVPVNTTTWHVGTRIEIGGGAQTIETSPDRSVLAVANTTDSELVILDAAGLYVERRLPLTRVDWALDLSFSPDGRFLAAGGSNFLYVFDTTTWQLAWAPARVHDGWALQTEWLDDGRTLATAGSDGTVALFDVERGLVRAQALPASGDPGTGYTHLVPGAGDELVVLSGDRSGRRYPLDPSVWLDEACAIVAGRDLTPAEWDRYLPGRDDQPTCSDVP